MEKTDLNRKNETRNPENGALLVCWREVLRQKADQSALFAPNGATLRTFSEIDTEAQQWAEKFAQSGSSVIALQTGNIPEWPALVLGIWYARKIALPLDLDLAPGRRGEVERLCGVSARVEKGPKIIPLDNPPVTWPGPAPEFLKLTSGTSAAPRVVRFTTEQLLADCTAICATMGLRDDDRNYGVISFAHSYGFSNLITPLLARGIALVVSGDMIPQAVRSGLQASGATVFPGVPALFRALSGLDPVEMPLRLCLSAGAPLSPEVAAAFHTRWNRKVHTFYGSSECGGICYDSSEEIISTSGHVGYPMQGVHLRRLEENWPSQIEIESAAVGLGYYPVDGADELKDARFRPADLLTISPEGYAITGRVTDLINVSGRKVNPSEIESVLARCPGVREVVVVGLPEGFRGEEVAACVAGDISEEKLHQFCAANLPAWQVPRQWVFVDALPVNARGKISRPEIKALF